MGHHAQTKTPRRDNPRGVLCYMALLAGIQTMPTANLPTFLPLPEAAKKFGMTEAILNEHVEAGTIAAGILSDGEILVGETMTDINDRLRAIRREDFEHLRGDGITVTEAVKKYGLKHGIKMVRQSITLWVSRGYIHELDPGTGRGSRKELDEADVAYCSAIHVVRKQTGIRTGLSLLDKNGLPGLLKYPNLSRYRREQRVADTR